MTHNILFIVETFGVILLSYICLVFIVAQIRRDNSVMDIAYGPAFLVSALGTLVWCTSYAPLGVILTGLIGLWSLRLALRIYRKNHGKPEDARYAAWRIAWMAHGRSYFLLRSFLQINLLQGIIIALVATPFLIAVSYTGPLSLPFLILGLLVYGSGITLEAIADFQLDQFLARKRAGTESAHLMTTGLFRFARRPNYFGETLIWWGMAIIVFPLPFGYLALISPLLITYIVTKVTGPMLENIFLEKYPEEYREYMRTTNYFIPWFPKA